MPNKSVDTAAIFVVGPTIDDTDFKTRETAIAFDAAGMDVSLHEETQAGHTDTALTLTSGSTQDWTADGEGYNEVEITAAQLDTEGIAWVAGVCDGVLPFESVHYDVVDPTDASTLSLFLGTLDGSGKLQSGSFASGALDAVWSTATRLLTAGTNIVLAKGVGVTGFNDLDAAGVRTAVGLASADLDTQLDAIVADTNELQTDDVPGLIAALNDISAADVVAALYSDADTAQDGDSSEITLAVGASGSDDFYNGMVILLVAGTGAGQHNVITDYVGSTKVASVADGWSTDPDSTTRYVILDVT